MKLVGRYLRIGQTLFDKFAMLQIVDHNLKFCTGIAAKLIKRNDGTQGRLGYCI